MTFTAGLSVFHFGMGVFNSLVAKITLHPFGSNTDAASAMLEMTYAVLAVALGDMLEYSGLTTLAAILSGAAATALIIFLRVR